MPLEMTPHWDEGAASGTPDGRTRENRYIIEGTSSRETAYNKLLEATQLQFQGLTATSWEVSRHSEDSWLGAVQYGKGKQEDDQEPPPGEAEFSMSGSGWRKKIKHSIKTRMAKGVQRSNAGGSGPTYVQTTPPDFKRLLNVTFENGAFTPKGLELGGEEDIFQITRTLEKDQMSSSYMSLLWRLRRNVNSRKIDMNIDGVKGTFDPGELMFLYADVGYRRTEERWRLTLHFSAAQNEKNLQIGEIQGIDKRGFDYLWFVEMQSEQAGPPKVLTIEPKWAYVEQVYEEADLEQLVI